MDDDDDTPSSASSDEFFSDEVNVMESDDEVDTSDAEDQKTPGKQLVQPVTTEIYDSRSALRNLARELVFGDKENEGDSNPAPEESTVEVTETPYTKGIAESDITTIRDTPDDVVLALDTQIPQPKIGIDQLTMKLRKIMSRRW